MMIEMSSASNKIKLDASWLAVLGEEFEKPYMQQLKAFIKAEKSRR